MTEQHLFILWENARIKENEILDEISSQLKIIKKIEIEWDKDKFLENLSSFYGFNHADRYFLQEERGNGKFLTVIVQDNNPKYITVETTKGKTNVNKKIFELKNFIRKKFFDGKFLIHATNTVREMRHDICLLTGKSLDDLNKENFFNGDTIKLKQNLPSVDGWKNHEQVFYILNETTNYVVIRDIENIPLVQSTYDSVNNKTYYCDIEILTDDIQNLKYILVPYCQFSNEFRFEILVDIDGKEQPFHVKFLGDRYFDINIEKKLLETKTKNRNNIWVIGNNEYYFYTLLYHGIIHKDNYQKYDTNLAKIAPQIGIYDYKCELNYLINLLYQWMKKNKYKYHQTIDLNDRKIKYKNIPDKSMIDNSRILYLFQTDLNCVVLTSDLIIKNPVLATDLLRNMDVYFKLNEHILTSNHILYKEFIRKQKNEIGWFFRKRFGRVIKTTIYINKKGSLYFIKKILGIPRTIENKYLKVNRNIINKKIKYIEGQNVGNMFKYIQDEKVIKIELERFFGDVFRQFESSIKSNNLISAAWDALPFNCIKNGENYVFFDLEYTYKGELTKSYFVWRTIIHTCTIRYNKEELYSYFCKLLNLPHLYNYYCMHDYITFKSLCNNQYPDDFKIKNGVFLYISKKITLLLVSMIPIKKYRKTYREKLKRYFNFPNRHLIKKYFIYKEL